MTEGAERGGVTIGAGANASDLLRELMSRTVTAFPEVFGEVELLRDPAAFRTRYADVLPRFELARMTSPARAAIARWLCVEAAHRLTFLDERGTYPLVETLARETPALPTLRVHLPSERGLTPKVDFGGRLYIGDQLAPLADELSRRHVVSRAAAEALRSIAERVEGDGPIRLTGERFVLFGAGAELSPVYQLLEAGAEVLWLDRHKPPIDRLLEPQLGGALHYVDGGIDLLRQPAAVRATIETFANGQPVHFGMYAFANGGARALRLALTMNAIVHSLPPALVQSVRYLLSPTAPSVVGPDDARCAEERRKRAGAVQRALLLAGPLSAGQLGEGALRVSSSVVSQQGASYQVAEYVGKRLAAEALIEYGSALGAGLPSGAPPLPLSVSANMAPITATRSIENPILAAAILGAPSFDMLIASASTSRAVASALLVHDLLAPADPAVPASARVERAFAQQFHGGVHAQPFALDGLIRMATLRGIAARPQLALELFR